MLKKGSDHYAYPYLDQANNVISLCYPIIVLFGRFNFLKGGRSIHMNRCASL